MSRADLFVVCKNPDCGAEVSPYVTECPYCGTRLQKRAPKLDKALQAARRGHGACRRRRSGACGPGEIPGIRADARPYATGDRPRHRRGLGRDARRLARGRELGRPGPLPLATQWPRLLTAPFTYFYSGSGANLDRHRRLPVRDAVRDRALRLAARAPPRAARGGRDLHGRRGRRHRRRGAVQNGSRPAHRRRQRRGARAAVRLGGARPAGAPQPRATTTATCSGRA